MAGQKFKCPKCLVCGEETKRQSLRKYCSRKCQGIAHKGENNPMWRGGRKKHSEGYWYVYRPEHPDADKAGYILEHRLVVSEVLGRRLSPLEVVHHKNRKKDDNRPENLELLSSQSEHLRMEGHGRTKSFEESSQKEIKYRVTISRI